ncbi:MAG: hypothetical protein U1F43_05060 [Myxococcota bacterium]
MRSSTLVAGILSLSGCAADITGPAPKVAEPTAGAALPVDPGVVCKDQLTTVVTVHGAGFSPLPHDLAGTPATWLPSVTLTRTHALDGAAGDGAVARWDGGPEGANGDALRWLSQAELSFEVRPQMTLSDGTSGGLPIGVFDVTIENANGATGTSHSAVALVPKPVLTSAAPNLVCLAQGPRTVTLAGTSFLELEGQDPQLAVADVAAPFELGAFTGCVDIPHPALDAALCTGADVVLATDAVPVGEHGLTVLNPETAACTSEDDIRLRVVPPPAIDHIEPPAECTAEATQDVVVVGQDFLEVDGAKPSVTLDGTAITVTAIGGTCVDLPTQGHTVRACTTVTVTVPVESPAAPRRPTLVLTNPEPAGCTASTSTALVLVPPPTVSDIQPPVICDDGSDQVLHFSGTWFFTVEGAPPIVSLDGTALADGAVAATGCSDVGVPGLSVGACDGLDVEVNPSQVDGDHATFSMRNPAPVECGHTYPIDIPLVAPPVIDAATPALVCTDDGARDLTISGSGFIRVGTANPTVMLDGVAATVVAMGGCGPANISTLPAAESCTSIDITISQGSLSPGPVTVSVQSPVPVGCGSVADVLVVPPHLVIDHVQPASVCTIAGDQRVTVHGDGFVEVDGVGPSVTLAGTAFAVVAGSLADCTDLAAPGRSRARARPSTSTSRRARWPRATSPWPSPTRRPTAAPRPPPASSSACRCPT